MHTLQLTQEQAESLLNIVEAAILDGDGDDDLMVVYAKLDRMIGDDVELPEGLS